MVCFAKSVGGCCFVLMRNCILERGFKMFHKNKRLFFFCAAFFLLESFLFAEYNSFGIPDSSEIRKKIGREWFEGPLSVLRTFSTEIHRNSVGIEFELRFEEQDDVFLTIIAPASVGKVNVHDSQGSSIVNEKIFSADAAGSWVLVRDKKNGKPKLVRYYFARDNEVFVQFRPNEISGTKNSTYADFVIFNSYAARAVPLGIPFSKFYTASFAEIKEITAKTLPWNFAVTENFFTKQNAGFVTYQGNYENSLVMIQTIRNNLADIVYLNDAIYDEHGEPVSLETGKDRIIPEQYRNKLTLCSQGFVKWIVDGIIEPLSGSYLRRDPLLRETVAFDRTGYQGVTAEKYNTHSALDWTRNLAAAALSVVSGKTILYENSGVDVTFDPFAAMVTDQGVLNTAGYINNSGYKILYLKQLLYVLAATNPDYFYLAAIRQADTNSKIETKFFNECVAIFPYFNESGAFRTVVFFDGKEYSLEEFYDVCAGTNRKDIFIHLTRVKATAKYYPQLVKKGS